MDHAEAREILELAAAEPGGVERLEAGDTAEATAVAGHLVECRSCAAEWRRLIAMSRALRATFAEDHEARPAHDVVAPPELKERTLKFVRELGRPVPAVGVAAARGQVAAAGQAATATAPGAEAGASTSRSRFRLLPGGLHATRATVGRLAAVAAVIVLVAGLGMFAYGKQLEANQANADKAGLYELAEFQARIATTADARTVSLAAPDGTSRGSIVFSSGTDAMAMLVTDIAAPGAGQVLRCWVDTASGHHVLGDAQYDSSKAYWSGWPQSGLADVKPGDRFGVSVVSATGASGNGTVLLTGIVGS